MTLELKSARPATPKSSGLRISVVKEPEHDTFLTTMSKNFGIPSDLATTLFSRAYVSAEENTVYLGTIDGTPVVTGMGLLFDGFIGVSAISTDPEHRKRGYGRLMTEHIIGKGREAGAHTAYLRPSEMAVGIYGAMGFRTAERWTTLTADNA